MDETSRLISIRTIDKNTLPKSRTQPFHIVVYANPL